MISVGERRYYLLMIQTMGDRLRQARKAAGFTSAESAAKALGMSASTYRSHENGQNNFGPEEAIPYGRKFKVSPSYLLTGETQISGADDDNIRISVPGYMEHDSFPPESRSYADFSDGSSGEKIPEIDLVAGMGGGGLATTTVSERNGIAIASEMVRAQWELPPWVLQKMNVRAMNVACFPCQGDSMAPTISDGDVVFIDTRHRVPSPPGIYALADEFGGVVVKRVEVVSNPRDEQIKVRVSSDNPLYRDKELGLDEIAIIGRYICRVAF